MSSSLPTDPFRSAFAGYGGEEMPLSDYAALVATFGTLVAGLIAATHGRPRKLSLRELLLLGISTHKLSRLISKDQVTAPFRAPFARFVKSDGAGEVEEEARGEGMQRAIGDLVTCPFCVSAWVALLLLAGLLLVPGIGRMLCGLLTSVAVAHFLHHGYVALENRKQPK